MDNRCFRLRRRPSGRITSDDLELCTETLPDLTEGQALVRTHLLSLDPTNRIWMSDTRGYMPPVPIGNVMRGIGVGQVVASTRADMTVGDFVSGGTGWQDYAVAGAPGERPASSTMTRPSSTAWRTPSPPSTACSTGPTPES